MDIIVNFDEIWEKYHYNVKDIEKHLINLRMNIPKRKYEEYSVTLVLTEKSFRKEADLDFPEVSDIKGSIQFIAISDRVVYHKKDGSKLLLKERFYQIHYIQKSKLNRIKLKRSFTLNNYELLESGEVGLLCFESGKQYFQTLKGYCFEIKNDDYEIMVGKEV